MSSPAEEVLRRIESLAYRRYLPIIGNRKAKILSEVVSRLRPARVLEVGTCVGYSAIVIAEAMQEGGELITVEYDEDEARMAKQFFGEAQLNVRITVLTGDALGIIGRLDGEFDMVFLDAEKHEYYKYLRLVENKLRKGGVVVADNAGYSRYSMRDYLEYVRASGRFKSRFVSVGGDGMEISEKL